jgi:hypothetical protein
VLLTIGLAAIPCLLLCVIFERSSGLRVTEEQEIAGLDQTYWDTSNFGDERLPEPERDGSVIPAAGTAALRTNAVTNATH